MLMEPACFKRTDFLFYGQDQDQFSRAELLNACHAALHAESLETASLSGSVVDALVARSLFERHGDGLRFGTNLAFINAALTEQLLDVARSAAQTYEQILADELVRLKALAQLAKVKGAPLEWVDIAHLIVAGLVIDLAIRGELLAQAVIIEQPDQYWVWAFECGTGGQNAFGVQLWSDETGGVVFGQLWQRSLRRRHQLKIDDQDVALLGEISERGSLKARSMSSAQHQRALKLTFYRLLAVEHAEYVLNIPVLGGAQGRALCSEIKRITRPIFSQAVVPAIAEARELYLASGLPHGAGNYLHAFARLLLECSIDRVLEVALIPAFPELAENNWGAWLSLGECIDDLHLRHR
jgi:hypothetical protein